MRDSMCVPRGQLLSAAALIIMRNATTFWPYCMGYQIYQVGNCTTFATLCASQPALQEKQRGKYGGYVGVSQSLGFFGAAVLGLAIGKGIISHDTTYAILLVMQFILLVIGLASFSSSPGFWEPELDEPTPEDERRRMEAKASAAAVGARAHLGAFLLDIAAPFRRPVYQWLFVYYVVNSVNWQIRSTFMQYYLSDVIGPDFSLHLPAFAINVVIASNPESAVSFLNLCQQIITTPLA